MSMDSRPRFPLRLQGVDSRLWEDVPRPSSRHSADAPLSVRALERLADVRTRDLYASHAERIGISRDEVVVAARRGNFTPRGTPLDPPAEPITMGAARAGSLSQVSPDLHAVWSHNRARDAATVAVRRQTESIVDEHAALRARIEEDFTRYQESTLYARSRATTHSAPVRHGAPSARYDLFVTGSATAQPPPRAGAPAPVVAIARPAPVPAKKDAKGPAGKKGAPPPKPPPTVNVSAMLREAWSTAEPIYPVAPAPPPPQKSLEGVRPRPRAVRPDPLASSYSVYRTSTAQLDDHDGDENDSKLSAPLNPLGLEAKLSTTWAVERAQTADISDLASLKARIEREGLRTERLAVERALLRPRVVVPSEFRMQLLPRPGSSLPVRPPSGASGSPKKKAVAKAKKKKVGKKKTNK